VLFFVKQKSLCLLEQLLSARVCLLTAFKFAQDVPTPRKSSYISCHPFLGIFSCFTQLSLCDELTLCYVPWFFQLLSVLLVLLHPYLPSRSCSSLFQVREARTSLFNVIASCFAVFLWSLNWYVDVNAWIGWCCRWYVKNMTAAGTDSGGDW